MKNMFFKWLIPIAVSLVFFWIVITPPSYFNFLPYGIHEALFRGSGFEKEFIIAFDFVVALLIFFLVRYLFRKSVR